MSVVGFFDAPHPRVFAHRGGCALGPENTLAAFDLGLAAGADGLELDVHLSADGVVVVHHDDTLDRTTTESGPLAARTAAELRRIDAGGRFAGADALQPLLTLDLRRTDERDLRRTDEREGSPTGIPTLREVLRRYPDVPIIVEMKVDSVAMGRAVAFEVDAARAAARVCAAGMGLRSLRAARAALPAMASSAGQIEVRAALYRSWVRWPVRDVAYGGYQVPEFAGPRRVVSRTFIRHAHAAGLAVQVWTVDEPADMERLLQWGVDGLITNRPDVAVRVRAQSSFVRS